MLESCYISAFNAIEKQFRQLVCVIASYGVSLPSALTELLEPGAVMGESVDSLLLLVWMKSKTEGRRSTLYSITSGQFGLSNILLTFVLNHLGIECEALGSLNFFVGMSWPISIVCELCSLPAGLFSLLVLIASKLRVLSVGVEVCSASTF